jgi:hypothetical protein
MNLLFQYQARLSLLSSPRHDFPLIVYERRIFPRFLEFWPEEGI